MLIDVMRQDPVTGFIYLLLTIPCILIALTVHEMCHGYAAYKLGDPTARNLGRLTLNPLKHLDPVGTICMLIVGFGWAKPVPINTRYFKKPRRDMALTGLAGPLSNFVLAFIGVLFFRITISLWGLISPDGNFGNSCFNMLLLFFNLFAQLNLGLGLFNLIPVPPLDGSRIFYVFLPPRIYFGVMKYERFISIAILLLLWSGALSVPLSYLRSYILDGMNWLVGLIPLL